MRRFLLAATFALLAMAVASPANAGYLIIQVFLDGSGATGVGPEQPGFPGMIRPGVPPGVPAAPGKHPAAAPDLTRSLVVVVPTREDIFKSATFYDKKGWDRVWNPTWRPRLHLNYRGDRYTTNLFTDGTSVQLYKDLITVPHPYGTRTNDIESRHLIWLREKTDSKALYDLIVAALAAGMVDEAVSYSDELLALVKDGKGTPAPEVAAFARAYEAIQKPLKGPPTKARGPELERWRFQLNAKVANVYGHYALISWDASPEEVARWSALLEENFKGFFLWHALRGEALPVPEAPLTAVIARQGKDLLGKDGMRLATALDAPAALPADGFYAADHDLLVLSPERLDDIGLTWSALTRQIYQEGARRTDLLKGGGPRVQVGGGKNVGMGELPMDPDQPGFPNPVPQPKKGAVVTRSPEEVARLQTLALVDRLAADAAAINAISREGTRQLLYATGQLPRHVALPQWVAAGATNFFARPKDPAYTLDANNKWVMTVATETGYGKPNHTLQRYFRDLVEKKDLNPDRAALLKSVLTDAYFNGLRDPKAPVDPDPAKVDARGIPLHTGVAAPPLAGGDFPFPGAQPGFPGVPGAPGVQPGAAPADDPGVLARRKRDRVAIKAQATAWALYYYLAKERPAELRKFLDELAALPRDLPLDGATVTAAFCRSFNLDEKQPASLARFADQWIQYMQTVAAAGTDVPMAEPKPAANAPGGFGGLPPGFPR